MARIAQYRAVWSVPGGGTGYNVFNMAADAGVSNPSSVASAFHAFYTAQRSLIPNDVSISFESEIRLLSDVDGALTGVSPVTPPVSVTGIFNAGWAGGAGYRFTWDTGAIIAGRRLRGRTYMVPAGGAYENDGTLTSGAISTAVAAGAQLVDSLLLAGNPLAVWSRAGQTSAVVTLASVTDKTAVLRSRRD